MKTTILIMCMALMLVGLVSAAMEDGYLPQPVKQFENIDLVQDCDDCTWIQLDYVIYPNKTKEMLMINMTQDSAITWSYSWGNTSQLGNYIYHTTGDQLSSATNTRKPIGQSITFEVTSSGLNLSTGLFILLLILSIGIVILGYYTQDAWIVILGSFGLVLVGLFILFYGIADMKDTVYTWGLGIITLMLGAYFGIKGSIEKLNEEL